MKVLQRSFFVLFALLLGAFAYPSLSQAISLSTQGEKFEYGNRLLISQLDYLSDADYVRTIWWNILGREVDDYGVGMHVQILTSGQQTRQQMRENIATSEESRLRIKDIYNKYLGRDPKPFETRNFVWQLGRGNMSTFAIDQQVLNDARQEFLNDVHQGGQ